MKIKCGKGLLLGKSGFTLIELLVVVLIIGILAAVALPQYNKAVVRAQTRKMILDVKEVGEAQRRYYLEHGSYATKFADLDIMPSGYPSTDCSNFSMFALKTDCIANENNVLLINNGGVGALFNQGRYFRSGFIYMIRRTFAVINTAGPHCYVHRYLIVPVMIASVMQPITFLRVQPSNCNFLTSPVCRSLFLLGCTRLP